MSRALVKIVGGFRSHLQLTAERMVLLFLHSWAKCTALQEGLDLIVVHGVGFDRKMHRIGHGKGYYDYFFKRCHDEAQQSNRPMPVLGISATGCSLTTQ